MNRFSVKTMLIGFLVVASFLLSVSPALANCDGWAAEGSSHRNAGNGCSYTCTNGSWAGPTQCDGSGNGQFQGAAATTAEERERQARAVAERNAEARAQVERQGAAETARIAASTAEQRAAEATRQQAMVENQRQQEVAIATRFGASAQDIAAINARAREAATFVSQAQGTDRGANLVGSDSQDAADIAARGYESTSSLATGVTVVNSTSNQSVGGGTGGGGGDVAAAALYTNPEDKCDILAPTDGNVQPGGKCCRGGNVECASGTCSAGSIGQAGVCSGGVTSTSTTVGPTNSGSVTSVSFRDSNGRATTLPVVSAQSSCTTGTRACAYQGSFVCVSSTTYAGENGCGLWNRDFTAQANRGSAETVLQNPSSCTGNTRGCMYGGGWVCVDKTAYPEVPATQDSSRGCAAWQRDYTRPQVGGTMTHKNDNGRCVLCAAGDSADVCKYSSVTQCSNAQALDRGAASRPLYRLLSGQGTSCIRCVTAEDVERYNCSYTESTCGGGASATILVDAEQTCNATPGVSCFCKTLNRNINLGSVCPDQTEANRINRLPQCSNILGNGGITTRSGANRLACLQNNVEVFKCVRGTAADSCGTATTSTGTGTRTDSPTNDNVNADSSTVTSRPTSGQTVSPTNTNQSLVTVSANGTTSVNQVVSQPSSCPTNTRGCSYQGNWVCVSRTTYPEVSSSVDSSRGCAAWLSDYNRSNTNSSGQVVNIEQGLSDSQVNTCHTEACGSNTCTPRNGAELSRLNTCLGGQASTALVNRCNQDICGAAACPNKPPNYDTRLSQCLSNGAFNDGADSVESSTTAASPITSTEGLSQTQVNDCKIEACGSVNCVMSQQDVTEFNTCVANERAASANTLSPVSGTPVVCDKAAGCVCRYTNYDTSRYSSAPTITIRNGESCPSSYREEAVDEACGTHETVPYGTRNSTACSTESNGLRAYCTGNYKISGNRCVAKNWTTAVAETASSVSCRISGNRLPNCNNTQAQETVSPTNEQSNTTDVVSVATPVDSNKAVSCSYQVCNASSCSGLTDTESQRFSQCMSSADSVAPVIRNGTCSQGHSQRIPATENLYCCNGNIVNRECASPVDNNRAGENLPNGTWCNTGWWATNTCVKCANGYHREDNGRDYCGPVVTNTEDTRTPEQIALSQESCGGASQGVCSVVSRGTSAQVCDTGFLLNRTTNLCEADVRVNADNRSDCGSNTQVACTVNGQQVCDTGSLFNRNINRCVPPLFDDFQTCSGTTYSSHSELTNLRACYSGSSVTGWTVRYYCPAGTSCTRENQIIGVNGCSLRSARANAVSCGLNTAGVEIFRCEHGPGRQENGTGAYVCPSRQSNGELSYLFPSIGAPTVLPPVDALFCKNRANGSYTDNGYAYNCCNQQVIAQGQQCVAVQPDTAIVCPLTGCVTTPLVAIAADSVIANPNQRWACTMGTTGTFTQTQYPIVCRACDGTSPVLQVSCQSLQEEAVLPVQIFDGMNSIREQFPDANPALSE